MTKNRWKESLKPFWSHIDPEKDEQLKWIKIEIDNNVRRILKLTKSINQGNKEANTKKKSELIRLIEDFHKQYDSLYALYDTLKGAVRGIANSREDASSSSSSSASSSSSSSASSDSETYFSPEEISGKSSVSECEIVRAKDGTSHELENSDSEEAYLKDKLISATEVVKEALNVESVSSVNKIQESVRIINNLDIEAEQAKSMRQKLLDENSWFKDKLVEREKELCEASVQTSALQEKIASKDSEAKQLREAKLALEAQSLERESIFKEKEGLLAILKKFDDNEKQSISRIEDLMTQTSNLQSEVDSLHAQKDDMEEKMLCETNKASYEIQGLTDRINALQQESESLRSKGTELELQLEKKSQELSYRVVQQENLQAKLASKDVDEKGILEEREGLRQKVKSLELLLTGINQQADQLGNEKEELIKRVFELDERLGKREQELYNLQNKKEVGKNDMSNQIISLTAEVSNLKQELESLQTEETTLKSQIKSLTQMEIHNVELTNQIADERRKMKEMEDIINKLDKQVNDRFLDSKLNLQIAERKMEEMAEEFRKKFEDNLRLLSRRISVAEELHVENKDWYRKTKETCDREHKDLLERVATYEFSASKIKDVSMPVNGMLTSLDTMTLKLEECGANFMNRVSKVSCELKFAKDWVMRKNKAMKHVMEDLDCLLLELDDKEAEILGFREKVWKLENKVRELEKLVKEKGEGMLSLGEEKREAIRQLCVWIDYHRGRSDYLKKMLSETTLRNQTTT
ncbi:hypothetical protein RJ639_020547 [Escallonia herrerae]|uniref:NAB domain-containing protein n=1 Tax=Escallonia herrerae TaxID=1293975 RepID=A0AA88V8C4_9ASTE|nr:hypothetical protein RJ639_020547 [Escallonia herrerae]